MSGVQLTGAVHNPPGFHTYLSGIPVPRTCRKWGRHRRDKPYRKFHIPCLEFHPHPVSQALISPDPQPYGRLPTLDAPDSNYGSGKAARKARRRARKRALYKQAKLLAEAEARQAASKGEIDEVQLEEEKKRKYRDLYVEIKRETAEKEHERNIVRTRSISKKAKEERLAAVQAKENLKKNEVPKLNKEGHRNHQLPRPDEAGYEVDVAQAKAGKGKAIDKNPSKKRKRGDDPAFGGAVNYIKTSSNNNYDDATDVDIVPRFEFDKGEQEDNSDDESTTSSSSDPSSTLPMPYKKPESLLDFPNEVLERIVKACDPISRTLLGLTNKHFGTLAINHAAGFPTIGDRYGSDLERHRFMSLLCGWMNRTYTQAAAAAAADAQPGTITMAEQQTALEKLKEYRLCYICRKYLPISGKQCQYWKNCPKKPSMPDDPASVAARDTEVERRRRHQHQHQQATVAAGPLPKITKLKPQPQTFEWQDEDWTTLSVGLVKSRRRLPDVKHICPKCTLTVHKVHLGWPPETPVVGR